MRASARIQNTYSKQYGR